MVDKQRLKELALSASEKGLTLSSYDWHEFRNAATPEAILALLEELRQSEERRQELINDFGEMQRRTDKNADMYRRDVQYALDLFDDVLKGQLTVMEARDMLHHVHQEGRKELEDWRLERE